MDDNTPRDNPPEEHYGDTPLYEYSAPPPRPGAQGADRPPAPPTSWPAPTPTPVPSAWPPAGNRDGAAPPIVPPQRQASEPWPSAAAPARPAASWPASAGRAENAASFAAPPPGSPAPPVVGWPQYAPPPAAPAPRRPRNLLYIIVGLICLVVLVFGGLLVFLKLSSSSQNALHPTPQPTNNPLAHAFSKAHCPFTPGAGIIEGQQLTCGYLTVPEDPAHPGGRTVKLAVAIFKPSLTTVPSDPFVYLSGGPGGALLNDLGTYITSSTLNDITLGHTLILMDQRGTGYSQPSLYCQEVDAYNKATQDTNLSREASNKAFVQALHTCHDRLAAQGINLNAYTTINDATDVHNLIHALGYKQVDLYGVSYGTRLALTVMRLFPGDLREVILDSTVPTQSNLFTTFPAVTQHAYDTLFKGCNASSVCHRKYPQIESTFYNLVNKLNTHPVTFQDAQYGPVLLNGDGLANWLFSALYVTSFIPSLPEAIDQINRGDYSLISRSYGILMLSNDISYGMYYSVECGEDLAFTTQHDLDQAAASMRPEIRPNMVAGLDSDYAACQFWGVQPVPPAQKQPVTSSVPTLILSGEYDPITPTSNAREAQKTLSNSYLFVFPATGHGVFLTDSCPDSIMASFMQNPQQKPDGSCTSTMPEPDFQ